MSINHVDISGNLTRDAELRQSAGGSNILGFSVAVNDRRRNPHTGEWEDFPNFVDCTLFGNRANSLAQYLVKGTKVAVSGKLRYSSWDSNGVKRSKLEVIADEIEFMSGRQQHQQAPRPQYTQAPQQAYQPQMRPAPSRQPQYQQAPQPQYRRPYQPQAQQASPAAAPNPPAVDTTVYDEDIPF